MGKRIELWGSLSTYITMDVSSETPCLKHPVAKLGLNLYQELRKFVIQEKNFWVMRGGRADTYTDKSKFTLREIISTSIR